MLASRIDRQPSEHKQLLQTLAVIGRESSLGLLTQVASHADIQLERMLTDLQASEFIYEQPIATDVEYVFKHALTQEVAYNSLLLARRKQLHERAGHALESLFADQLDDHVGQLAHHYSHSENVDKAIEYLGRAGQQSMQRSAYDDAISSLSAAIDLLRKLPDSPEYCQRELQLQLALGPALIATKGWSPLEVERTYSRARELCERLSDPPESFAVLFGVYALHLLRAELRTAHELAVQLLRRAETVQDPTMLLIAHQALGQTSFQRAELPLARKHLERVIALYDRERHRPLAFLGGVDFGVAGLSYAAQALWTLGYPDQSLKTINEALALAQGLSHPHTLAFAEFFFCIVSQCRREVLAVRESSERGIALGAEHGFTAQLALMNILHGWSMAKQGHHEEGLAQLQESLAAYRATRGELARSYWLLLLADAYKEAGRPEDSIPSLAEALTVAEEHEDLVNEPEMYRIKGELLLQRDDSNSAEAQSCLERAIDMARRQSAKSWQLRATTSLARLLAKQGGRAEARAMLAEIYNWFTEGFDTADLKDAKALLNELAN